MENIKNINFPKLKDDLLSEIIIYGCLIISRVQVEVSSRWKK